MAHGGRRKGAGRPPGAANVKSREIANKAAAEGITPLEVMIQAMRLLWAEAVGKDGKIADHDKAMQACAVAKNAAPYMHPRLQQIVAEISQTVRDDRAEWLRSDLVVIEELRRMRAAREEPSTVL